MANGYSPFGMIGATGEAYSQRKAMDEWVQSQADKQEESSWWGGIGSTIGGILGPAAASLILGTTLGPLGIALAAGAGALGGGKLAQGAALNLKDYDPDWSTPGHQRAWNKRRSANYEADLRSNKAQMDAALESGALRTGVMAGVGSAAQGIAKGSTIAEATTGGEGMKGLFVRSPGNLPSVGGGNMADDISKFEGMKPGINLPFVSDMPWSDRTAIAGQNLNMWDAIGQVATQAGGGLLSKNQQAQLQLVNR